MKEMPDRRRAFCIALAVMLCGTATRAAASCPLMIDGDATLVERVWSELEAFSSDGTPCIALRVVCRRNGDRVEVHVRDAVGRSSQREFASPGGAAAFIVSWSLRPTTHVAASALPAMSRTVPGDPAADPSWHPEVAFGYSAASGPDMDWGVLTASVVKSVGPLRFGGALRALTGEYRSYVTTELALVAGVVGALHPRWTVRGELVGAKTLMTFASHEQTEDNYGTIGVRGGIRGVLRQQFSPALGMEVGLGYDRLRNISAQDASTFGRGLSLGFWHLDVGILWVP